MNIMDYTILSGVAFSAAAINSVAGGGTFLTFPALIFMGCSPVQANVTSTVAVWPGSVASALAYRGEWQQQKKDLPVLMAISIIGAALGACVLLTTPERQFARLVPWLLLAATLIFTLGRRLIARLPMLHKPMVARTVQFLIAFYGGYFGAGIGILMLAMLQLMGLSHIHRMNGLKTLLGTTINAVAVLLFVFSGRVVWDAGLVMLFGAVIGGYAGARLAQKCPPEPVRWLVSGIGCVMTAYFFVV